MSVASPAPNHVQFWPEAPWKIPRPPLCWYTLIHMHVLYTPIHISVNRRIQRNLPDWEKNSQFHQIFFRKKYRRSCLPSYSADSEALLLQFSVKLWWGSRGCKIARTRISHMFGIFNHCTYSEQKLTFSMLVTREWSDAITSLRQPGASSSNLIWCYGI